MYIYHRYYEIDGNVKIWSSWWQNWIVKLCKEGVGGGKCAKTPTFHLCVTASTLIPNTKRQKRNWILWYLCLVFRFNNQILYTYKGHSWLYMRIENCRVLEIYSSRFLYSWKRWTCWHWKVNTNQSCYLLTSPQNKQKEEISNLLWAASSNYRYALLLLIYLETKCLILYFVLETQNI